MNTTQYMWIYENNADNTARFVLGTKGKNPLICFGINPSTAEPNALDATLRCVRNMSYENEYDSFVMLNIYPQRATNPNDLHENFIQNLKDKNEYHISNIIAGKSHTIWAAWGALIDKRPYLSYLLNEIIHIPALKNCTWVTRGKATKRGHPHHPLYVKKNTPFICFDMELYKETLHFPL